MRITVKNSKNGFTLVEMAIVIMIVGLLMAPAIGLYNIYKTNERVEQSDFAMQRASDAVGGFLAGYGRYPCPAPANAVPGDLDYGYEDCTAGTGITLATSLSTALTAPNNRILIGSLPFRTLNLQESETHDGYGNRLTYAVTQVLTDKATYALDLGGISVVDDADENAITPEHSAHFVIVTHGEQSDGSIDYNGSVVGNCDSAPILDRENCNNNSIFRNGSKTVNYDDEINYASGIGEDPWQYQDNTKLNIHLKVGSQNVVTGQANLTNETFTINASDNPIGLEIRDGYPSSYTGTGQLSASNVMAPVANTDTGAIITDNVCDDTAAINCFNPRMIGGNGNASTMTAAEITPAPTAFPVADIPVTFQGKEYINGGNVYCEHGAMVGVENGKAICAYSVTLACPDDPTNPEFLKGIDAAGRMRCEGYTTSCPAQTTTGYCGGSITIPGVADGARSAAYSGRCYKLNTGSFNSTYANTLTTLAQLNTYVASLNNNPALRTEVSCPSAADTTAALKRANSLVRETFVCDGTSFDLSSRLVRKRGNFNATWPASLTSANNASSTVAYPASPASPMSVDPNNNATNHDCWCREDYVASQVACTSGGTELRVRRYQCPNTSNTTVAANMVNVWNSGLNFCNCAPGPFTEDGQACYLRFGQANNIGVIGNVTNHFIRNCSPNSVSAGVPATTLENCTCPARADQLPFNSTDCPAGTGNTFVFEGITYTNKSSVSHRRWNCPTGVGGNVTSSGQVGSWTTTNSGPRACTCIGGTTGTTSGSCGPLQTGTPPVYETILNCATGTYTPTTNIVTPGTCQSCSWQPPAASPAGMDINISAVSAFSTCNCNSGSNILRCKNSAGAYWNSCQCKPE